MKMLLQKGACINDLDNYGGTAFHNAAYRNSIEAMQFLLECGASVNIRDIYHETPADIVRKGNNQKAKDFLDNHLHKL